MTRPAAPPSRSPASPSSPAPARPPSSAPPACSATPATATCASRSPGSPPSSSRAGPPPSPPTSRSTTPSPTSSRSSPTTSSRPSPTPPPGSTRSSSAPPSPPLATARRIDIYGVGASALVGQDLAQKLLRIGLIAHAHSDPHLAVTNAVQLRAGDVAIAITHSGSTGDVIEPLRVAFERGRDDDRDHRPPGRPGLAVRRPRPDHLHGPRERAAARPPCRRRTSQLLVVDCLFVGVAQRTYETAAPALSASYEALAHRHTPRSPLTACRPATPRPANRTQHRERTSRPSMTSTTDANADDRRPRRLRRSARPARRRLTTEAFRPELAEIDRLPTLEIARHHERRGRHRPRRRRRAAARRSPPRSTPSPSAWPAAAG